jgi:hypothetical protein
MSKETIESYCVTRKDFDVEEEETSQELWDAFMKFEEDDERRE